MQTNRSNVNAHKGMDDVSRKTTQMFPKEMSFEEKQLTPQPEHREGKVARAIEQETAKLPSDVFLWSAFGAMGASLILQMLGAKKTSNFIGLWAPSILIMGLYNKIVKVAGSH